MADPKPALAAAFLILILLMPVSGKYRFSLSTKTKKQLKEFLKDHATDLADLFPNVGSYNDKSRPAVGEPGRSQAPATNAGKYIFSFDVGTPPQRVSGALDITSQLVWMRCDCPDCAPGGTLFYPSNSSTMVKEACTTTGCQKLVSQSCGAENPWCSYTYMNGNGNTTGYFAQDKFILDSSDDDPVKVVFGCSLFSEGDFASVSGVIGLGRGPLSLVSQLREGRFSYYLAPDDGTESFLNLGGDNDDDKSKSTSSPRLSTPLLANKKAYPHFYYVGLTGLQVDGKDLPIPTGTFDFDTDGSGGVILSITVPVTFLDKRAYTVLKKALATKIGLPTVDGSDLGLDLCYTNKSLAAAKIPAMALVFDGGAVMELETWNYFYMDADTGLECLTILPSEAGGGSLLGNLIQAGTHMIYDVSGSKLLFESADKASAPVDSSEGSPRICLSLVLVNFVWVLDLLVYMHALVNY